MLSLSTSRIHPNTNEAREIRTPNLLIWSQTRCRCAIAPHGCCLHAATPAACLRRGLTHVVTAASATTVLNCCCHVGWDGQSPASTPAYPALCTCQSVVLRLRARFSPGMQRAPGSMPGAGDYCCSHSCSHPRCTPSAARTPAGLDIHVWRCPFPCTSLFSAIGVGQTSDPWFKYNGGRSSQPGSLSTCTRSACKFSCLLRLLTFRDNMRLARAFRTRCQDRSSGDSATGSAQVA